MKKRRIICYMMTLVWAFSCLPALAQTNLWQGIHKAKKKETLYSISRDYGITVDQLMDANPEMRKEGYQLKKGDIVFIPYPQAVNAQPTVESTTPATRQEVDVTRREVRLGVMLPLHDKNGDGRRMTEYYRGVLMAVDSLKRTGLSIDVSAWNLPEDGDPRTVLSDERAQKCDLIIGPLYTKQVKPLADFCTQHDIRLLIPFSIHSAEVLQNPRIFQVYQSQNEQTQATVRRFMNRFRDCHPIIIDCGDSTSTKGPFTSTLRRELEAKGTHYSLTSLKSTDANFLSAFSTTQPNVVVLNTARQNEMAMVFGRLSAVALGNPDVKISVMGYTEWLGYARRYLEQFYKYDVHVPSPFYTNLLSPQTERLTRLYKQYFHTDMQQQLPRFALTGFDHACFFLQGLHRYGKQFVGSATQQPTTAVQTPLKFERIDKGGLQNKTFMFVHYKPDHSIETMSY